MRGITEYHRSCADNLHEALKELGLSAHETPSPFKYADTPESQQCSFRSSRLHPVAPIERAHAFLRSLWMNVPWDKDGKLENKAPASKPRDYITLRADMDAVVVFSACPNVRAPSGLLTACSPPRHGHRPCAYCCHFPAGSQTFAWAAHAHHDLGLMRGLLGAVHAGRHAGERLHGGW